MLEDDAPALRQPVPGGRAASMSVIRSERRLCDEVHLNLGYRWFCRLGLDTAVPDHSTFSKARHGRFRDADLLRKVFETVVRRCMAEGLVGGEGVAVDGSLVTADASRQRGIEDPADLKPDASRAVTECLAVLDDTAFGAATTVQPKFVSPVDPAARWTAASDGPAVFACADNYLIDLKCAVIHGGPAGRGRRGQDHDRPHRRAPGHRAG